MEGSRGGMHMVARWYKCSGEVVVYGFGRFNTLVCWIDFITLDSPTSSICM